MLRFCILSTVQRYNVYISTVDKRSERGNATQYPRGDARLASTDVVYEVPDPDVMVLSSFGVLP